MSRIIVNEAPAKERAMPTFAKHLETGDIYIIHNTHNGPEAVTWAVNMQANGERHRYDNNLEGTFQLLDVGTLIQITV